jgi:hypothetical protein
MNEWRIDQCLCCRFTDSALSQLQLPVLVRFSSYAIMLESMLKYRHALVSAVLSEDFVVASSRPSSVGRILALYHRLSRCMRYSLLQRRS